MDKKIYRRRNKKITIQELIDKLNEAKDKSLDITYTHEDDYSNVGEYVVDTVLYYRTRATLSNDKRSRRQHA